jgi:hypothetical protein
MLTESSSSSDDNGLFVFLQVMICFWLCGLIKMMNDDGVKIHDSVMTGVIDVKLIN